LATALWQFWWLRGYLSEGRRQLETLLAPAGDLRTSAEWAMALNAAGVLAFRQGDYASAQSHLDGSLAIARVLQDPTSAAVPLRNLGRMALTVARSTRRAGSSTRAWPSSASRAASSGRPGR